MEYNKLIAEMHTGDDVEGFYVLKDAFLKTTAAGKPFLSGVLADRSGVIDLKVWDYSGPIGARPDYRVIIGTKVRSLENTGFSLIFVQFHQYPKP